MTASKTSPNPPGAVRRAVVPAAGRGTRMRALAADCAKELLSVAGRPLLAHAFADLAAGGVTDALVVTSRSKPELARFLGDRCEGVRLCFVEQPEPRGLADALSLAESFVSGEPFVVWLPDNLWRGAPSASAQIVRALRVAPQSHFVGLLELPVDRLDRHGAAGFVEASPLPGVANVVRIERVLDKGTRPRPAGATVLKGFPLDLYQPDLFDLIRACRARQASRSDAAAVELDDTPILQELARAGRLHGVVLRGGTLFDCGVPDGFAAARAELGL